MHSQELVAEAIKRRLNGDPIKKIARELRVSVGWASDNLSAIRPRLKADRPMLTATPAELKKDQDTWGAAREAQYRWMDSNKRNQREQTVERLRAVSKGFSVLPPKSAPEYVMLDRLQQILAREPGAGVFHVVRAQSPELMAHLLGWLRDRHGKTQDKSDARFMKLANGLHDHVLKHQQAPSHASQDEEEVAIARWLGRWISNARGTGERKRNIARAGLMLEIGGIVECLRSSNREIAAKGRDAVNNGTWSTLFKRLKATKNSYLYEVPRRRPAESEEPELKAAVRASGAA